MMKETTIIIEANIKNLIETLEDDIPANINIPGLYDSSKKLDKF